MKQTGLEGLRGWRGVAMGLAGACALAAQAMFELSALEAPPPAYAAQAAPPVQQVQPAMQGPAIETKG